jgi:serine/threonine protein kinase
LTGSAEQFDRGEAHVVLADDSLATPIGQPPKKGAEGWYPPETALGEPGNATTDYFSLGTTLYRDLFGSIPINQYTSRWRALRKRGEVNDENDKILVDLRQHPEVAKDFTRFLSEQFQLFRHQHRLSKRESAAVRYLERLVIPLLSPDPAKRVAARDVPEEPLLRSLIPSPPRRSWTCRLTFGLLQ